MITLEAWNEKLAEENPFPGLEHRALYHQVRTLEALRDHDLVVNTYDTGTGKTFASLLYLFELDAAHKAGGSQQNVLFVAPTNALLTQHAEDIEALVERHDLDFRVQRITAGEVRALQSGLRPGETLQRLIANYLEFELEETRRRPLILVVNPDIYYYAMYFRYHTFDRRNLFERFLLAFDYVIIDEFHYYDSKQLANFLFLFALFDSFGYFEVAGRKVCLLSATPTLQVQLYLERIFGPEGGRWKLVAPENESVKSEGLPVVPTLAPLELGIASDEMQDWVNAHRSALVDWVVQDDLDGAMISNSLWRINEAFGALRRDLSESRIGRITGPEPEEARRQATFRNLILATPTVDIGYNFKKAGKDRQNVDFLICDARYGDGLRQRIGRAGRVLGKAITDRPSRAIALLPLEAIEALSAYDGQAMSRAQFKSIVRGLEQDGILPAKNSLYGYIRSHAITESFYPIYEMGKMMPDDAKAELEALYEKVVDVFAPGSRRPNWSLASFFRKHDRRGRWLDALKSNLEFPPKHTDQFMADWLSWERPESGVTPKAAERHVPRLWRNLKQRRRLVDFVKGQYGLVESLFSFRDSFQGPSVVVHDPKRLLSSEPVNVYDLFHVLSYYETSEIMSRTEFVRLCDPDAPEGDYYLALRAYRENKLSISFSYDAYNAEIEREDFEARMCAGEVVPLKGLNVVMGERGGDMIQTPVEVASALADDFIAALIVAPEDRGALSRFRGTPLWWHKLNVNFPPEREYFVFLGTAAFHAGAELYGYFLYKDRMQALEKAEAFII